MDKNRIISLEEVLTKFKTHNDEFISEINREEDVENLGSINSIQQNISNDIKSIKYSTDLKKSSFINELKSGLGEEVKKNPNKITKIEKTWYQKFSLQIKNIFTRF
jgi:hypothetical protein